MKVRIFGLILLSIFFAPNTFAVEGTSTGWWLSTWDEIVQFTSEKVPGADCVCVKQWEDGQYTEGCSGNTPVYERKYKCTTQTGIKGFAKTFQSISGWVVRIGILLGVLAIAALGIAWAIAWDDNSEYKKTLKEWIVNLIIGLIILFAAPYILSFLGSWIYK